MNEISKIMRESVLFKGLEADEILSFLDQLEVRIYPPSATIFTPEDTSAKRIYVLQQGRVNLFRLTPAGKRLITWKTHPGSTFGLRRMFADNKENNYAVAVEKSTLFTVSKDQLMRLVKLNPYLMENILKTVFSHVNYLEERFIDIAYTSVRIRLAQFLLDYADPDSGILNHFTHEEIGDDIGASRQKVTKELNILRKQGILNIKLKQIQILDRNSLTKILSKKRS
jgi:CRP/FNR family transcriptional regulator, cyclic AMP receptor protein